MLIDLLIEGTFSLLGGLLSLLPDDSIDYPSTASYGSFMGQMVGPWDAIFPIAEFATITTLTVTVIAPAVFAYRLSLWVYGKIPVIGK